MFCSTSNGDETGKNIGSVKIPPDLQEWHAHSVLYIPVGYFALFNNSNKNHKDPCIHCSIGES